MNSLTRNPSFLGFDKFFDLVANTIPSELTAASYPPFNLIKEDNTYTLELAVAGFGEEDLSIETKDNTLTISGKVVDKENNNVTYVTRGLAARQFKKVFLLADTVEVQGATLDRGILSVRLMNIVPEKLQPKMIPINTTPKQVYLQEERKVA